MDIDHYSLGGEAAMRTAVDLQGNKLRKTDF